MNFALNIYNIIEKFAPHPQFQWGFDDADTQVLYREALRYQQVEQYIECKLESQNYESDTYQIERSELNRDTVKVVTAFKQKYNNTVWVNELISLEVLEEEADRLVEGLSNIWAHDNVSVVPDEIAVAAILLNLWGVKTSSGREHPKFWGAFLWFVSVQIVAIYTGGGMDDAESYRKRLIAAMGHIESIRPTVYADAAYIGPDGTPIPSDTPDKFCIRDGELVSI